MDGTIFQFFQCSFRVCKKGPISPSVSLLRSGNEEDSTQQYAQVPQSDGKTLAVLVAISLYSNHVSCAASYAYRLQNTVAIRAVLAITRSD